MSNLTSLTEPVKPELLGRPYRGSDRKGRSRKERARIGLLEAQEAQAAGASTAVGRRILASRRVKSARPPGGWPTPRALDPDQGDRRSAPRCTSVVLGHRERERLRTMESRAAACGKHVVAVRRGVLDGGRIRENRMLVPAKCGTRVCPDCDAARRRRESVRVEGRWQRFVTLGIPSGLCRAGTAWRRVSKWVRVLMERFRKEWERKPNKNIFISRKELRKVAKENEGCNQVERPLPELQYAWCLEPHKSGWPHVHIALNARKIATKWLKRVWGDIVGAEIKFAGNKRVFSIKGVCWYLSKYISKTQFTPEISAIMYRRRQWACTRPDVGKAKSGWELERRKNTECYAAQRKNPELWGRINGWATKLKAESGVVVWERFWNSNDYHNYLANRYKELLNISRLVEDQNKALERLEKLARRERAWTLELMRLGVATKAEELTLGACSKEEKPREVWEVTRKKRASTKKLELPAGVW